MKMDEKRTITLGLPYGLIMRYNSLIEEFWLDYYVLREWLAEPEDIKYVEITPKNAWILDLVRDAIII